MPCTCEFEWKVLDTLAVSVFIALEPCQQLLGAAVATGAGLRTGQHGMGRLRRGVLKEV